MSNHYRDIACAVALTMAISGCGNRAPDSHDMNTGTNPSALTLMQHELGLITTSKTVEAEGLQFHNFDPAAARLLGNITVQTGDSDYKVSVLSDTPSNGQEHQKGEMYADVQGA